MRETQSEGMEKLAELIRGIRVAMMTTVDDHGRFHSRPMAICQDRFDSELWFFTDGASPKIQEIRRNNRISVTFANPDDQEYVAVSGVAEIMDDRRKARELWNPYYKAWFPKGPDEPNIALLRVAVESAEYWDSSQGKMVRLSGFAKPLAHKRIDLAG